MLTFGNTHSEIKTAKAQEVIDQANDGTGVKVLTAGVKWWGDSNMDGGLAYLVLERIDDVAADEICTLFNFYRYGYGPGRPFGHDPFIWHQGQRTIITHNFGYDI